MALGSSTLTWIGHSTALIEIDGTCLLTDPVLRRGVVHLRRLVPRPEIPDRVDGVLISHAHHDHLDPSSLRLLGRETPLFVPRGTGRMLRRRGFRAITELEPGQGATVGGVPIRAVHAEHRPGRGPLTPPSPALGYLVGRGEAGPEHWRAYFAGDTDLFDEMADLTGRLDLALLPVAGWGKKVGAGHLDPPRAVEAVRRLRPGLAVPIHWGTLAPWSGRGEPDPDPAKEFEREVERLDVPTRVGLLEPGGRSEF